jgi:hypothetical protein
MMRRTMPIRKRATVPRTWRGAYATLTAAPAGRAQAWGALPGAGRGGIWAGTPQPGSADAVRRHKKSAEEAMRAARAGYARANPAPRPARAVDARTGRGSRGGVSTFDAEATLRLTGFSLRYCRLATVTGRRTSGKRGSGRSPDQGPEARAARGFDVRDSAVSRDRSNDKSTNY